MGVKNEKRKNYSSSGNRIECRSSDGLQPEKCNVYAVYGIRFGNSGSLFPDEGFGFGYELSRLTGL